MKSDVNIELRRVEDDYLNYQSSVLLKNDFDEKNLEESTVQKEESRENWGGRFEFLLACVGYSVGLGNFWRFGYLVSASGGGAFLIPYFINLCLVAVPLMYMEFCVGQFTQRGPIGALGRLCPILKGS